MDYWDRRYKAQWSRLRTYVTSDHVRRDETHFCVFVKYENKWEVLPVEGREIMVENLVRLSNELYREYMTVQVAASREAWQRDPNNKHLEKKYDDKIAEMDEIDIDCPSRLIEEMHKRLLSYPYLKRRDALE